MVISVNLYLTRGHYISDKWSQKLYGEHYDIHKKLGYYQSVWLARAESEEIYQKSASGGVVTQICLDLLEGKRVDGVVARGPKGMWSMNLNLLSPRKQKKLCRLLGPNM